MIVKISIAPSKLENVAKGVRVRPIPPSGGTSSNSKRRPPSSGSRPQRVVKLNDNSVEPNADIKTEKTAEIKAVGNTPNGNSGGGNGAAANGDVGSGGGGGGGGGGGSKARSKPGEGRLRSSTVNPMAILTNEEKLMILNSQKLSNILPANVPRPLDRSGRKTVRWTRVTKAVETIGKGSKSYSTYVWHPSYRVPRKVFVDITQEKNAEKQEAKDTAAAENKTAVVAETEAAAETVQGTVTVEA